MRIPFRLLPKGAEENVFKKIPDGWLFTTASPKYLRLPRTYLVTDDQKPEIAAQVRRSRYINLMLVMIEVPIIMAACAKYPWLLTLSLKAFIVWGATLLFIGGLAATVDHFMMRSIVKGLPRTTQEISLVDRWRNESRSLSTVTLAFFTAFAAFCAAVNLYTAVTESRMLVGLGAAFMASLAIYFGAMLVAKYRARPKTNGC